MALRRNVSYRLDEDEPPTHWTNAEFDDNMRTKDTNEQVVKIWRYDKFWNFREIVNELSYKTPIWEYNRFKVGDIVRVTFSDNDVITYFVNKDGFLSTFDGAENFSPDRFPTYDRIKNSPVVNKVELMKLETVKEL